MGNHGSHESGGSGLGTPRAGSRRGSSLRGSGAGLDADKPDRPPPPSLVPIEKLGKILAQRSQKEDGVNGITEKSFTKYLFPLYPELARRFYRWVCVQARCGDKPIPTSAFKQHAERILSMLDDHIVIDTYVRMFASEDDDNEVHPDGFRSLLYTSYKLSMDHYPEGPQTCLQEPSQPEVKKSITKKPSKSCQRQEAPTVSQPVIMIDDSCQKSFPYPDYPGCIHHTLSAVVNGCFNKKDEHSVGFVVRWLEEHCHRLIFPIHRYCVHMLATRHRDLEAAAAAGPDTDGAGAGLELATPVLERSTTWATGGGGLLPVSAAWLLAGAAPPLYSRPVQPPNKHHGLASRQWLARLVCALPVHWAPLYTSRDHGLGANRFLHHTLNYRGPTVVLLRAQDLLLALCSPNEWKETHQYWGGPECVLIQLQPTFAVVEHAPKMLYLNTSIRGYPKGLRAGSDPRKPLLIIPEDFDSLTFKSVPYSLDNIEVWGCGDQASRETQLDIKKWQVREAERQRQVKLSAADWMEHPDRYLLELAGRPQYNNSAS